MEQNKRVLIAVGLSVVVLLLWSLLFPSKPVPPPAPGDNATPAARAGESAELAPLPEPVVAAAAGREVTVETPLYEAVFSSRGGVLLHFRLKNFDETILPGSEPVDFVSPTSAGKGPLGLLWSGQATWRGGEWDAGSEDVLLGPGQEGTATFTGQVGPVLIARTLSFAADTYLVREKVRIAATDGTALEGRLGFSIAAQIIGAGDNRYNPTRVSWLNAEGQDEEGDVKDLAKGLAVGNNVRWAAVQDNYFLVAAAPDLDGLEMKAKHEDDTFRAALEKSLSVPAGQALTVDAAYYLGPRAKDFLAGTPSDLERAVTYGWSDFLAKPLLSLLNWFYSFSGNWGVAIILLTVLIKIVFWPLSHKSYKSMSKMKKIQPLMAKVREQHKDDRQKMNEEMMQLYKTYKVNPAGGCLPMLLQIPVFIGLYQALLGAIELRHAPFITTLPFTDMVWLADLSAKDPYYITPIVMGATMFLQQKLTPSPGDPMQAKLMLFMPIVFTFIFLNFPAGLVIYWLVNNVLSIAQQWWLTRKA
jgi:YidC/Oxa1 family membrane protein insertase